MEICSSGHDEIVFEGGMRAACPACDALGQVADLQKEINEHSCEDTPKSQ